MQTSNKTQTFTNSIQTNNDNLNFVKTNDNNFNFENLNNSDSVNDNKIPPIIILTADLAQSHPAYFHGQTESGQPHCRNS